MRAFKIDESGVTEIDAELGEILNPDLCWDCVSLANGHDVWVDDEGLFKDPVVIATIDDRHRVPLPAFVLSHQDERSVAATLSLAEMRALVRIG